MLRRYNNNKNNNRFVILGGSGDVIGVMLSIVLFVLALSFIATPKVTTDAWLMVSPISMTTTTTTTTTIATSHRSYYDYYYYHHHHHQYSTSILSSQVDENDEFASFAATLEDDYNEPNRMTTTSTTKSTKNIGTKSTSSSSSSTTSSSSSSSSKWQNDLDKLIFDRTTTIAQRQILISDLFNANNEIRQSLTTALRDRTIDPLLTPTGRKLQDGTRAVAYQLQTDIIPSLTAAAAAAKTTSSSSSTTGSSNKSKSNYGNGNSGSSLFPPPLPLPNLSSLLPPIPNPEDVTKFSNRLLNTVTNQIQKNMETFQADLQQDPRRIPSRIVKQAEDIMNEASNVFAETPIGLQEPPYTVVMSSEEYEIRDYPAYTVATTTMSKAIMNDIENSYDSIDNDIATPLSVADQGVAFNTLASYIFGANDENRVMDMTTPVTTTMSGEMRFYIPENQPPEPLSQDAVMTNEFSYDTTPSKIRIEQIPAARLAVRRFTGFVTNGEILRQKEALLNAIQKDSNTIEIDVPHGQPVKHIIFQYNPPYTIPVLRRNEIAVPVTIISDDDDDDRQELL